MPSKSLLIFNTCLGNLFEHYDTALFSLLAPFIATQFFPQHDPLLALILTYAIIPLGMLARPLGSLFFGYIGDMHGRQRALAASLVGMAIITALMGLIPTYHHIGLAAPLLLLFGKTLQNFFAAGEIAGGAIYLIENMDSKSQHLMSSLYGSSTIAGILLASFGVALLSSLGFIVDGWRLLYLLGFVTAFCGCLIRFKLGFEHIPTQPPRTRNWKQMIQELWNRREIVWTVALASGFSYATYSMAFVLINGFIPFITNINQTEIMHLNTTLLIFDLLLLPIFGLLSNRFSSETLMLAASIAALVSGIPLFAVLDQATFLVVVIVRMCLVLIGVCFSATYYSWAQQLVPPDCRYSILSFSYAIGSQLFGGPTAAISLWMYQKTHVVSSVCWYWLFLGGVFIFTLIKQKNSAKIHAAIDSPI